MFYGVDLKSRLMLGTAQYPSPAVLQQAIAASGAEVITVSLRREGRVRRGFPSADRGNRLSHFAKYCGLPHGR